MIKSRTEIIKLKTTKNTTLVNQSNNDIQIYALGLILLVGLGLSVLAFIVLDNKIIQSIFKQTSGIKIFCKFKKEGKFVYFAVRNFGLKILNN
jgi:hypothetical protein